VGIRFLKAMQNMKVDVAGLVFLNLLARNPLFIYPTTRMAWLEPKWSAESVRHTWGMFLKTALSQQA
jgi:hypothetical protein